MLWVYPMLVVWEDDQHGVYTVAKVGWNVEVQTSSHGLLIEDDVSDLGVGAGFGSCSITTT